MKRKAPIGGRCDACGRGLFVPLDIEDWEPGTPTHVICSFCGAGPHMSLHHFVVGEEDNQCDICGRVPAAHFVLPSRIKVKRA